MSHESVFLSIGKQGVAESSVLPSIVQMFIFMAMIVRSFE